MRPDSWNDFRLSAINGDLERIKTNHADKDFRIFLQKDQSALDLAAQHGHVKMVDYFLDNLEKFTNHEKEIRRVLSTALRDACKYGQTEMVKILIQKLRDRDDQLKQINGKTESVIPERYREFILLCAISSTEIEVLNMTINYYKQIVKFDTIETDTKRRILKIAFETGSSEVLSTVIEYLDFKVSGMTVPVPECFIHCALGHVEKVYEELEKNGEWYLVRETFDVGNFDLVYRVCPTKERDADMFPNEMRLVGIAARFGHFSLVKNLVERIPKCDLNESLGEILIQSWSTDRLETVEWLHQTGKIKLRPPHTYPGINKYGINGVFHYMRRRSPSLDGVDPFERWSRDYLKRLNFGVWNIQNDQSIDVIEHYIDSLGEKLCGGRWEILLTHSMSTDSPRLALKLMPWGPVVTDMTFGERNMWQWATDAVSFSSNNKRELPSITLIEIAIEKVICVVYKDENMGGGLLDDILRYNQWNDYHEFKYPDTKLEYLPEDLVCGTIREVVSYHVRRGGEVCSETVRGVLAECLLSTQINNPHFLARACIMMDFFDVTTIVEKTKPKWYRRHDTLGAVGGINVFDDEGCIEDYINMIFEESPSKLLDARRDVVQRHLLLLLWFLGCENSTVIFPGLLVYLLRASDERRKAYFRLISFLGIVVVDTMLRADSDYLFIEPRFEGMPIDNKVFEEYKSGLLDEYLEPGDFEYKPGSQEIHSLSYHRAPTLLEAVRNSLFKLIRKNQVISRERGSALGFQEAVSKFASSPEVLSLPVSLSDMFRIPTLPTLESFKDL